MTAKLYGIIKMSVDKSGATYVPNLKKNIAYNFTYQFMILILPMITLPYISRVLGSENIGIYSFAHTFANYFLLCAVLGINTHGNRSIAAVRDDINELSRTFLELFIFKAITTVIMLTIYVIYCVCFVSENKEIYLIDAFFVLSGLFNINWFSFGMENFKLTTIRSAIVQIINTVSVFIFVKTSNDLWIYTMILAIGSLISTVTVWPYALKTIHKEKVYVSGIIRHIKPAFILFIPILAMSIYNMMDKLMLGYMSTKQEVGFYECASRVIVVPNVIIDALYNTAMPRMSHLYASKKNGSAMELMDEIILFTTICGCAMCFGLGAVGKEFAILFYGSEFARSGIFIVCLCPVIIFKCLASAIRMQYIIPTHNDNVYVKSIIFGAVINLLLNSLLIPHLFGMGAIIGTLAAEFIVMFLHMYLCRDNLNLRKYLTDTLILSAIGAIMLTIVKELSYIHVNSVLKLVTQIIIGAIVYLSLAFIFLKKKYSDSLIYKEIAKFLDR